MNLYPTRYNRRLYPKGHILALCGLAYILAACGQPRPVIVAPPVELTTCAAEPDAPDLPPVDWSSVETARPVQRARDIAMLNYVLAWRTAHGDCAAKVAGLREWSRAINTD